MICKAIDAHAHIGRYEEWDCGSIEDLLSRMDKTHIETALVSDMAGNEGGAASFENTLNIISKYKARLKPLLRINPSAENDFVISERMLEKYGDIICGMKVHPSTSKVPLDDLRYQGYIELCEKYGIPFFCHTEKNGLADVSLLAELARRNPNVDFVAIHTELYSDHSDAIKLISEIDNLYGDTTFVRFPDICRAVRLCGSKKILFGTDFPISPPEFYAELFSSSELSDEDRSNILYKNCRRLLDRRTAQNIIDKSDLDIAFDAIDSIIRSDIAEGFTSAQLAVTVKGQLVFEKSRGLLNSYSNEGTRLFGGIPVTNDTLYDLASNTKMYSVNYALQYLATNGRIDLDSKIVDIIGSRFADDIADETSKEWKRSLTVRDVLRHQAGFPADPQYHNVHAANILYAGSDSSERTKQNTLEMICGTPLIYEPGTETLYSDVDYMLLGFIIERITGKDLGSFLSDTFWKPMGLSHITYCPLENGFSVSDCAATELNGNTRGGAVSFDNIRTDTIQGQVHDEKAYYCMGGVSGHAGLFSNASDLARLASLMLDGTYNGKRYFSQDVIDTFISPRNETDDNWGLGWWRQGNMKRAKYFGTLSSQNTIGHQGWTGTLTMIDPDAQIVIVYLTNKINSPVTDRNAAPNVFDGNYFTSATLGFVPELIYTAMMSGSDTAYSNITAKIENILRERINDANAAAGTDESHPAKRAVRSIENVLRKRLFEK